MRCRVAVAFQLGPIVFKFRQTNDVAGDLQKRLKTGWFLSRSRNAYSRREQSAGGLFKFILQLPRWLVDWAQKPNGKQQTNTDNFKYTHTGSQLWVCTAEVQKRREHKKYLYASAFLHLSQQRQSE